MIPINKYMHFFVFPFVEGEINQDNLKREQHTVGKKHFRLFVRLKSTTILI